MDQGCKKICGSVKEHLLRRMDRRSHGQLPVLSVIWFVMPKTHHYISVKQSCQIVCYWILCRIGEMSDPNVMATGCKEPACEMKIFLRKNVS